MNVYLVHSTALSRSIFIYVVLWAFPPYSSVYTVSFLYTPSRFPLTFMPCMYSCFISIYILRGQFRLLYGWWGIRIIFLPSPFLFLLPTTSLNILLANTSQVPSRFLAPSFRVPQPVCCTPLATDLFCTLFWWFGLFGDYVFLFIWVFSVIMNFSVKLILSRLGSKVWYPMRAQKLM